MNTEEDQWGSEFGINGIDGDPATVDRHTIIKGTQVTHTLQTSYKPTDEELDRYWLPESNDDAKLNQLSEQMKANYNQMLKLLMEQQQEIDNLKKKLEDKS